MTPFAWECPHCNRPTTIAEERYSTVVHNLHIPNAKGRCLAFSTFIVCPSAGKKLQEWRLVPASGAKTFPDYIRKSILDDYREACLIRDLSPKASATLSRRCLQGMIRDFWEVKAKNLAGEIEQIEAKVAPMTWQAIDAVRKIGNIGAHMEKDIDVIIDVDPNEAELLIGLVETLLTEWYVAREERNSRMKQLIELADEKKPNRNAPPPAEPTQQT